tara:strand:+ start:180 stop:413 length:234 start_codon:yes stop_codon:yes gene_type:complete
MFLYINENNENNDNILINKYIVEHNLDSDTFSLWLLDSTEFFHGIEIHYEEFITYDEVYKYLGQLRFNYLERFKEKK